MSPSALFRWPEEIPGLGRRSVGAFVRCPRCPCQRHMQLAGTFTRYGDVPVCMAHAQALFQRATGPNQPEQKGA